MSNKNNQQINLRDALDNYLHSRSISKSIATLLSSKRKEIDYTPYYQRNYVWDDVKATFFIESILLGVEIPPLILFAPSNDKKKLEVVDGRQRFQTLKRFFEGKFTLKEKGLHKLKTLAGSSYEKLDKEIQRTFTKTTLRTIEFSTRSTLDNAKRHEELEDKIKKEIFRRYNSGITPLKTLEVQKALHLDDSFTNIMQSEFSKQPEWLSKFKEIFFHSKENKVKDAEVQAKIRELLVLQHFPINVYSNTSKRKDLVEQLFYSFIEVGDVGSEDIDASDTSVGDGSQQMVFDLFIDKIQLIYRVFLVLELTQWVIYQSIFWGLVIIEDNDIDIESFLDAEVINELSKLIKSDDNIATFTELDRGLAKPTNKRFSLIADFFQTVLANKGLLYVDFSSHLKSGMPKAELKVSENDVDDVDDVHDELYRERLIRPDAETTNIDDLITDMKENDFLIRPAYQRVEVINAKKASGIIESMLLGIPLPTIFVYRRKDGICEVVDGQQRLLSILAFIGDSKYEDEDEDEDEESSNRIERSKKENYKLFNPLSIIDCGGKRFLELSLEQQEKIWDFELSIVYIDEESNPNFDPIDLFIRLNNKPYPVKDQSFEMWNSFCDRKIIGSIQKQALINQDWFYYRKDNKRMEDEELLTVLSYLQSQFNKSVDDSFNCVDIYQSSDYPMIFRLPKLKINEWLDKAEGQEEGAIKNRDDILTNISDTSQFISKVDSLVCHMQSIGNYSKANAFDALLGTKTKARNQRHFYMLWYLLINIEQSVIKLDTAKMVSEIQNFLATKEIVPEKERMDVKNFLKLHIQEFWRTFN